MYVAFVVLGLFGCVVLGLFGCVVLGLFGCVGLVGGAFLLGLRGECVRSCLVADGS